MEAKDWLGIFIPLLFNGIIFFGLHFVITRYIDKNMNYKNDTLKQCLVLIQNVYELSYTIDILDPTIGGNEKIKFADIWNPFNESVVKLSGFIKAHPNIISIDDFELGIFFERVNTIRKLIYNDRINNNNMLSDDTLKSIFNIFLLAQKDIEKSTDLCEKRILNIK